MELFQKLGFEIERDWLAKNYNEAELPAIAKAALERADLPSKLSAWDVVEWTIKQYELPRQRDLKASFADPPITVFSGLRFNIDVYFWFEGTTATHEHAFCGAFQVLEGSSIHSWYEFGTLEEVSIFVKVGEMKLKTCELLDRGQVQEIWAGSGYIHSLFHLEQPSATIVVRTDRSPISLPQLQYHKPGFAVDPFFEQDTLIKKIQAMSTLLRAQRPEADSLISDMLTGADLHTSYQILAHVRHYLDADSLSSIFKLDAPTTRFNKFLDIVIERHGKTAEILREVFAHQKRVDEIMRLRGYVSQPELRFFMALLLNADSRERIFSLIQQRSPDADPKEKVLDWTFDLAQTRVVGIETSNALGIPDFGDLEMSVLEEILDGKSDEDIRASLPNADAGLEKIRNAPVFRPLLA